ncbi:Predicted acetyltransferase [Amycolatopsis xylanica]|uniref:Predicted acetyltransferase n=1 Tax=Amycolatopsis xylanica TaxID=589385 RepID=A0A1H3GHX4_9PSEU|nr:GNAT family N-acetyltransferase [Amycolatopsis xylanica]SDY02906.1 Predicted acetyltransferase [Amycolatopsis xylanica]
MTVELVPAGEADKPVLENLLQFYLYDFSEIRGERLTPHGTFTYRYLDYYFLGDDREAWFITVDGELAGFAFVRGDLAEDWNVGEFFVLRKFRRQGVATEAARLLFTTHPGEWTLSFDHGNAPAVAFWPAVARAVAAGPVEVDDAYAHESGAPSTRLRFHVADL